MIWARHSKTKGLCGEKHDLKKNKTGGLKNLKNEKSGVTGKKVSAIKGERMAKKETIIHDQSVTVNFTDEQMQKVKGAARAEGLKVSPYIRWAMLKLVSGEFRLSPIDPG